MLSESEQWPFFAFQGFIIARLAKAIGVNPRWSLARFSVLALCLPMPGIVENYQRLLPALLYQAALAGRGNPPSARPGEHWMGTAVLCCPVEQEPVSTMCSGCPLLGGVATVLPCLMRCMVTASLDDSQEHPLRGAAVAWGAPWLRRPSRSPQPVAAAHMEEKLSVGWGTLGGKAENAH